ncbi:nitroreductase family protein [Streptomyces sp. MUM 2J]|uniref:Acg family FMN-binding oxidoreductase n=1 Tax=Streptomyces sp. MUM 2J TaxID=2791987 RepID=UPI001F03F8A3|nr:nitroreductase family protein [Streptomyces sp. MUM 2J]MCH0565794.1 nitroreductase family protein [Streptomyces sp. MUM 2J]
MPAPALDREAVTSLVRAATAAPSLHNAQPWRFRWHSGTGALDLRADPERTMPRLDPGHRALHLGCGAALFNLRVAAADAGRPTDVRLLPDPADPWLLATVGLSGTGRPDDELARLYPAISRRHTSRHPFEERPVPPDVQEALGEAARQEGAQLVFPGPWHTEALLDHVRDAEDRDSLEPERLADVRRWVRVGERDGGAALDGIPEYAFGPRKRGGRAPVRDFAGRETVPGRAAAVFETVPNLVLLGTENDRSADWLRAGQALERVLLRATLAGLATALTSHSLERPDLRELARDPESSLGFVQMVLRLGYGAPGAVTPRRPVEDVLDMG